MQHHRSLYFVSIILFLRLPSRFCDDFTAYKNQGRAGYCFKQFDKKHVEFLYIVPPMLGYQVCVRELSYVCPSFFVACHWFVFVLDCVCACLFVFCVFSREHMKIEHAPLSMVATARITRPKGCVIERFAEHCTRV